MCLTLRKPTHTPTLYTMMILYEIVYSSTHGTGFAGVLLYHIGKN